MGITQFSLRNPLVVTALAVVLCVFGIFAYLTLGVAITPNVNYPSVVVMTRYPGADPESVEANVTRPIEDAIAALPNIDTNGLTSTSMPSVSIVTVQFTSAANPDLVSNDVQRVVNAVRSQLPADADDPAITKVDINALGVAKIVLSGPQSLSELQDVAEKVVQPELNAVPGVGTTSIRSGVAREVHITVDQERLRARGLSLLSVINALQSQQIEVPAGTVANGGHDFSVYFDSLAAQCPVAGRPGRSVDTAGHGTPQRRRHRDGHHQRPRRPGTGRRPGRHRAGRRQTAGRQRDQRRRRGQEEAGRHPAAPAGQRAPGHGDRRLALHHQLVHHRAQRAARSGPGDRPDPAGVPAHVAQHAHRAGVDPGVAVEHAGVDGGAALQPEPADDGGADRERRHPGRRLDRRPGKHHAPPCAWANRRSRQRSTAAAKSAWRRSPSPSSTWSCTCPSPP